MKKGIYSILTISALLFLAGCSTCRNKVAIDSKAENGALEAPFWSKLLYETYSTEEEENFCLSPLSAQLAMSIAAKGAEGETLKQMQNTIGNYSAEDSKELIGDSKNENSPCEVKIANSIWINENFSVKERFITKNKTDFNAEVRTIPFDENAAGIINNWCKENTKGKIEEIIDEVEALDMMFLINALYFKAPWRDPFKTGSTTKEDFTTSDGNIIKVEMMKQTFHTPYYSDDIVQIVAKPFKERYEMLFILPWRNRSIGDAINHIAVNYKECIDSMKNYRIDFSLPKFRSEYGTSLKNTLCNMGMEMPFGKEAQFGGISDIPLYIKDVFQKTFISVDEEGAEAAAVTSVTIGMMSMRPQQKITMKLDRPFIYAIRDKKTDRILFIGKVGNPNK